MKMVKEPKDRSLEDKTSSTTTTEESEPKDISEGEITNMLKDLTEKQFRMLNKEAQEIAQKMQRILSTDMLE